MIGKLRIEQCWKFERDCSQAYKYESLGLMITSSEGIWKVWNIKFFHWEVCP